TIAMSFPPLLQRPVRDVPDRIGCVLPEALQDLPGELADLCIGGGVPPLVENVPPRPDIAGDDHLDFGCVRQHRTSRLKRLLAPVSATDQLLDQRGVRIHCVLYGVVEHLTRRGRVLRDQRRGDDPLRVVFHVALADDREAQVTVPLQLGQQGPADTFHVERDRGVLQHGEVPLPQDVVQVPPVGRRARAAPLPSLVAISTGQLGQLVHLGDPVPGSINVRDIPGNLTGRQAVESCVSNRSDLHITSSASWTSSSTSSCVYVAFCGTTSRPSCTWAVTAWIPPTFFPTQITKASSLTEITT